VPTDKDTPRLRRSLDKGRMEAFSDGVFAFAATLLVVDLALGHGSSALQQVTYAWPGYLAYVTSFLDDRRCVAPPHRIDRPARAGRFALPAAKWK
jgi:Endosomal/lysosomal potassium channel TMEM175